MATYFETLKSILSDTLIPTTQEFVRAIPDSLFLGTGFFALITQNFPLGVLVLAIAELAMSQRILGSLVGIVQENPVKSFSDKCSSGIPSPYQLSLIGKLMSEVQFPSGPVFLLAGVISYTLSSTFNFREELKELGKKEPEWNARIPLAVTFSILLLAFYVVWRYMNECDGVFSLLGSTAIGAVIGFVVYIIHVYLFGRDAVNFLGIPLLADRAANGSPLYACAKQD
jgi:hypothetical protein